MIVYYSIRMTNQLEWIVVRRVNHGLGRLRTTIVDLTGYGARYSGLRSVGGIEEEDIHRTSYQRMLEPSPHIQILSLVR